MAEKFIEEERDDKAVYYLRRASTGVGNVMTKINALGMLAYRYVVLGDIEMSDLALYELLSLNPKSPQVYDMLMGNSFAKGDIDLFRFYLMEKTFLSGKPFYEELPDMILPVKSFIQPFFDSIKAETHRFSTKQTRVASSIGKALVSLNQGDYEQCLQELDKVQLNLTSLDTERIFLLVKAKCCYLMGKTSEISAMLDRAWAIEPNDIIIQSYVLLYTDKKYDDDFVEEFVELASEIEFVDSDLVAELVRTLVQVGKLEDGLELVESFLQYSPCSRNCLHLKGVIAYNLGDLYMAIQVFDKLNNLFGDYTNASCYLKVIRGIDQKTKIKMGEFEIEGLDEYFKTQLMKVQKVDDIMDGTHLDSDVEDGISWLLNTCIYDAQVMSKLEEIASLGNKKFTEFLVRRLLFGGTFLAPIKQVIIYILMRYGNLKSLNLVDGGKFRNVEIRYPDCWRSDGVDEVGKIAYSRAVGYAVAKCQTYDTKSLADACDKINAKILQNGVIIEESNMYTRLILESAQDSNIHIDNTSPWLQVDMEEYNSLVQNLLI